MVTVAAARVLRSLGSSWGSVPQVCHHNTSGGMR